MQPGLILIVKKMASPTQTIYFREMPTILMNFKNSIYVVGPSSATF